ncbi:MAG TPA: aminotransferase class V-fold PLP-dependent enzyme [Acidobacteriota bacterium]|nr:aminotransferase class V-fold PLP-dependent enzyme [Acidobacteriota bacterium]
MEDRAEAQPFPQSSIEGHRARFPALANKAYFNYGAEGPLPSESLEAMVESYRRLQQWGPFSTETHVWLQEELQQTRAVLAGLLGAPANSLLLTENISLACNVVLWGFDWTPGDHLLLSDCENPGIVAAAREVARRNRLELSFCRLSAARDSDEAVEEAVRALRPRTRMVLLSHVLWNTGLLLNLNHLSRALEGQPARPRLLIDGAQSVGVMPVEVEECGADAYAFTGQKWLCGPSGLAGLYLVPDLAHRLRPTFTGWRSLDDRPGRLAGQDAISESVPEATRESHAGERDSRSARREDRHSTPRDLSALSVAELHARRFPEPGAGGRRAGADPFREAGSPQPEGRGIPPCGGNQDREGGANPTVPGRNLASPAREESPPTKGAWPLRHAKSRARDDVRRFEIGSSAYPLCAGLRRSLKIHRSWGTPSQRYQRILKLAAYLHEGLQDIRRRHGADRLQTLLPRPPQSGIVSFQLPDAVHTDLVFLLESEGVMAKVMPGPECLRVCVHYFTTREELNRLLAQLEAFLTL